MLDGWTRHCDLAKIGVLHAPWELQCRWPRMCTTRFQEWHSEPLAASRLSRQNSDETQRSPRQQPGGKTLIGARVWIRYTTLKFSDRTVAHANCEPHFFSKHFSKHMQRHWSIFLFRCVLLPAKLVGWLWQTSQRLSDG